MSAPVAPVLNVQNVHYQRGRPILRGINWTVNRGEHWCILGPNGCGKTSLINLITGYDCATEGVVQVDGNTYGESDWREVRKRVGLVTNTLTTYLEAGEPVLHVIASGRDAKLNLWQDPPKSLRRHAATLLKAVGCDYLKNGLWGHLSQGEKQKILICRALMAKFHVLILDEPCAGLDPVARENFLEWMSELATWPESPSLIMVTHHVEEILPCMSHVFVMQNGRVAAAGKKGEVMTSDTLSAVYGAAVKLSQQRGRYSLEVLRR